MKLKILKKKIKKKNILITGNTGFVGSWLSLALLMLDANILGYSLEKEDKNFLSNHKLFKKKIKTIYGDIINFNKYNNQIKKFKPEIVIHLASQPLVLESYKKVKKTYLTNVIGTVDLFETLKNIKSIKKIIIFTSDKVYQNFEGKILRENSPLGGIDPYSSSKSCQDIIASSYKHSILNKKTSVTILRAGNIIGGGDWNENRIIPDIFKSIINKSKIKIRNPNAIRPWQHILEIINSFLLIIIQKKTRILRKPQILNIAPNIKSNIKVIDLINLINKENVLKKINYKIIQKKYFENKILRLSGLNAKNKIKFVPKLNLKKTIKLTSDWYQAFYMKKNMFNYTYTQIKEYFDN
jgi:CDP-glucose 4,6-dehydratase